MYFESYLGCDDDADEGGLIIQGSVASHGGAVSVAGRSSFTTTRVTCYMDENRASDGDGGAWDDDLDELSD